MNVVITKKGEIVVVPDYGPTMKQILRKIKYIDNREDFIYHMGVLSPFLSAMYMVNPSYQDAIETILATVRSDILVPKTGINDHYTRLYLKDLQQFGVKRAKLISSNNVQLVLDWLALKCVDEKLTEVLSSILTSDSFDHIIHLVDIQERHKDILELSRIISQETEEYLKTTSEMLENLANYLAKGGTTLVSAQEEPLDIRDMYWLFINTLNETLDYWAYVYTHCKDPVMLQTITKLYHPFVISQYDGSTFNFVSMLEKNRASSYALTKIKTPYLNISYNGALFPITFKTGVSVIMAKAGGGKNLLISHLFNSLVGKVYRPEPYSSLLKKIGEKDIAILSMKERSEFIFDSTPGNMSHEIEINVQDDIINFHDLIKRICDLPEQIIIINSILPFVREVEMNHKGGTQSYGIKSGPIDDVLSTLNTIGQLFNKVVICTYRPGDDNQLKALVQPITGQAWLGIILDDNGTLIVDRTGTSGELITNCKPIKDVLSSDDYVNRYLGKYKLVKSETDNDLFKTNYELDALDTDLGILNKIRF